MKSKTSRVLILCSIFFLISSFSSGMTLNFVDELHLYPKPLFTVDFCVDKNLIIIPDQNFSKVLTYLGDGNVFKSEDRIIKYEEFVAPTSCYLSKEKLAILDLGKRVVLIFNRSDSSFEFSHALPCPHLGYDLNISDDKVYISGFKRDPKYKFPFELYSVDLDSNQINYILPSHIKYGFGSTEEYLEEYTTNPEITIVGVNGWFDIYNNSIYYVWEGLTRIIKIDFTYGQPGKQMIFGKKTKNYKRPYASPKLFESSFNANEESAAKEKRNMTYVRNIFASEKYILLICEGPSGRSQESNIRIQFYDHHGVLVKELPVPRNPSGTMYFDKKNSVLYSLKTSEGVILKYAIK